MTVIALILVLAALGDRGREALSYDRDALAHFQLWRALTAHWVHLSWRHALLNCAGLVVLWALFAREFSPRRWLWILTLAAVAIDLGLWFLHPTVVWYVGASGVLHGAWSAGACAAYRRGDGMGAVIMLLLVVKLAYEQQAGVSIFEGDLPLVTEAHLLGAFGGLLGALMPRATTKPL
ncbi:MAG TPA: rhombosortase [Steroidobacteraceae bacterium]|nr:rhombosortase [Steroidobacteraceae bacterium]